jgi:hypothetical protein
VGPCPGLSLALSDHRDRDRRRGLGPGPSVYLFIAMASAGLYVPFSLQVTLGQDYLPSKVGTASGITLGLTVSIGGLASPLLGVLADKTSLQTALVPLIVMPVLSWLMFRTLGEPAIRVPTKAGPGERNCPAGEAGSSRNLSGDGHLAQSVPPVGVPGAVHLRARSVVDHAADDALPGQ